MDKMTEKKFNSIVKKLVRHGNIYRAQIEKLEAYCQQKYGINWSEVDADTIIDKFEFGCGNCSAMTFDEFNGEIEFSMGLNSITIPDKPNQVTRDKKK